MSQDILAHFDYVYDKTYLSILRYVSAKCCETEDAKDIIQEVYTEFFKILKSKGISFIREPEAFLISTARKKLFKRRIKNKGIFVPLYDVNTDGEEFCTADTDCSVEFNSKIEENFITEELLADIWSFVSSKDKETENIFILYYVNNLSINDISEKLKIPVHSVKNKLYRTIAQIRQKISGKECCL